MSLLAGANSAMPTYLCHGFRWKRRSIRVYVVVQNLDDAAPEWVIKRGSARCLIESFYDLFDFLPECTIPPARSSHSEPQSTDRSSVGDDDGRASGHTTRADRSGSRSQARAVAAQQNQGPCYGTQHQEDPTGPGPDLPSNHQGSSVHQAANASSLLPSSQSQFPSSSPSLEGDDLDPILAQDWSPVKLIEEYDPNNLEEVSRPYAYVTDYVQRIDASCGIVEEIAKHEQQVRSKTDPPVTGCGSGESLDRGASWFEGLRDQLQRDEEIKWYVVVNGDEERAWPVDGAGSEPDIGPQYNQQPGSEGHGRNPETRRQQLRNELGYKEGGIDKLVNRRLKRAPKVPETEPSDLPPLKTDLQAHSVGASRPNTARQPGRAFRRMFRRSRTGENTP